MRASTTSFVLFIRGTAVSVHNHSSCSSLFYGIWMYAMLVVVSHTYCLQKAQHQLKTSSYVIFLIISLAYAVNLKAVNLKPKTVLCGLWFYYG